MLLATRAALESSGRRTMEGERPIRFAARYEKAESLNNRKEQTCANEHWRQLPHWD